MSGHNPSCVFLSFSKLSNTVPPNLVDSPLKIRDGKVIILVNYIFDLFMNIIKNQNKDSLSVVFQSISNFSKCKSERVSNNIHRLVPELFKLNLTTELIQTLSDISDQYQLITKNIENHILKRISIMLEFQKEPSVKSIISIFNFKKYKILKPKDKISRNDILTCLNILFQYSFHTIDSNKYIQIGMQYINDPDWKVRQLACLVILKVYIYIYIYQYYL